jgi:hypothetical protein
MWIRHAVVMDMDLLGQPIMRQGRHNREPIVLGLSNPHENIAILNGGRSNCQWLWFIFW